MRYAEIEAAAKHRREQTLGAAAELGRMLLEGASNSAIDRQYAFVRANAAECRVWEARALASQMNIEEEELAEAAVEWSAHCRDADRATLAVMS